MKIFIKLFICIILFLNFNFSALAKINENKNNDELLSIKAPDEIIFYSNGSIFSPVVVIEGDAQVLWTWDDGTTSNSATPIKNYGSAQLRKNILKITPWSAVKRINIGYDANEVGSPEIEMVDNQFVSSIENLENVAPYLREWCSSYNQLTSLDLSNFVNLETIECYHSQTLQSINLTNTPKLKRVCLVLNSLVNLDLSSSVQLEQVFTSYNLFSNIILPTQTQNIWTFVLRDNPQITNPNLINNLSNYPNISNLAFWNCNQSGDLIIPKTSPTRWVGIRGYNNNYTSLDLRGSFQNPEAAGLVDMHNNKLTKVEIAGCHQIKTLNLSQNLLSSEEVEYILKQLDEFGPTITTRSVDLSKNQPITTEQAKTYKKNLEAKGWEVLVEYPTSSDQINEGNLLTIFPNPSNGKFHIQLNKMPVDGVLVEINNIMGQKLFEKRIFELNTEWYLNNYEGKIFFVTIRGNKINETKKIIIE